MFDNLQKHLDTFLNKVFDFINELDIDVSSLTIDHIALRYKSDSDVDLLSAELKTKGKTIAQAIVNGRKSYIFKLDTPLVYKGYKIPCVELPYPASNHDYLQDGWEHIEFVLPSEGINNFENVFKKTFPNLSEEILKRYNYTIAIPEVEGEQLLNPTVILTKYKGLAIKFHANSIEKVVAS